MAVRTSLIVVLSAAMTACATPESGVFRGGAAMRGVPDRLADPTETRVIACREVSAATTSSRTLWRLGLETRSI
jgi:hypothetical protein